MFNQHTIAAFVKESMEIQTVDSDTPPGYVETKAAVGRLYGINKQANLLPAVTRMGKAGKNLAIGSVAPAVKGLSVNGMQIPKARFIPAPSSAGAVAAPKPKSILSGIPQTPFKPADSRFALRDHVDPFGGTAFRVKLAARLRMLKEASIGAHAAELAGLGILAKPSIDEMRGKHVPEKSKARMEVAGLGVLAAPAAHEIAKAKSLRYSNLVNRVGSAFGRHV